jgi:hypothetical protein
MVSPPDVCAAAASRQQSPDEIPEAKGAVNVVPLPPADEVGTP